VKPGTHPQDGESEARGEDKPGTHPEDGESEARGEDKPGTHPQDGESERRADKNGYLWMETETAKRKQGGFFDSILFF